MMVKHFDVVLLCILVNPAIGTLGDEHQSQQTSKVDRNRRIPRVMRRMYQDWATRENYMPKMIQSLPAEVTPMDEQMLLVISRLPDSMNAIIRKVELWMEFYDVKKPLKLRHIFYGVEVTPATDAYPCYIHITQKPKYRDNQLEMNLNITAFYVKCKENGEMYLELLVHLYPFRRPLNVDEDLTKYPMNAFIILHEFLGEDGRDLLEMAKLSGNILPEIEDSPVKRQKRAAEEKTQPNRNKRYCGLRKWYVTFDDIEWNWIIAPAGYTANRCEGICSFPLSDHMNSTNHAVVQTMMNSIHGKPESSCCVPKETAPLTIISLEDNGIISMKKFEDMIVISCACL